MRWEVLELRQDDPRSSWVRRDRAGGGGVFSKEGVRVVGSSLMLRDEEEEAVVGRASTKLRKVAILG